MSTYIGWTCRGLLGYCRFVGVLKMTFQLISVNIACMVSSNNKGLSAFATMVGELVRENMSRHKITQATVAEHLHRSPNYVSERVTMKRSWTMQDIDALAKLFGLPNGFALVDEARGITKEGR